MSASGFRGAGLGAGAARALAPRLAPFLMPIPGAAPLLFGLSAIAAAYALYKTLGQWRLAPAHTGFDLISGPCAVPGYDPVQSYGGAGTACFYWPPDNPFDPYGDTYTLGRPATAGIPPVPVVLVNSSYARQPGYSGAAVPFPLPTPTELPRVAPFPEQQQQALSLLLPVLAPQRTVDQAPTIPVSLVWARDRVANSIANISSQFPSRGYDAPALPWAPATRPIDRAPAVPITVPIPSRPIPIAPTVPVYVPVVPRDPVRVITAPIAPARPIAPVVPFTPAIAPNREIKTRAYPLVSQLMHHVVGLPSEVNDMLQALHDALPDDCRNAGNARRSKQNAAIRKAGGFNTKYKRVKQDSAAMLRDIGNCLGDMNVPQAVANLIDEALTDRANAPKPLGQLDRSLGNPLGSQMVLNKAPGQDRIVQSRPKPVVPGWSWNGPKRVVTVAPARKGAGARFLSMGK